MKKPGKTPIPTKYILSFLSFICVSLVVLTMINAEFARPVREAVTVVVMPIQKGINHIGNWFSDKAYRLKEL